MHLGRSHPTQEKGPEDPRLAQVSEPYPGLRILRCVWRPLNFYQRIHFDRSSAGQSDTESETTKLTQEPAVKLEQGETFVSGTQWQTEK